MKSSLLPDLTNNEIVELLSLSHQSLTCCHSDDFKDLMLALKKFFEFENVVCAHGNVLELLNADNAEPHIELCDISYPEGYMDLYFAKRYYLTDAVFFRIRYQFIARKLA